MGNISCNLGLFSEYLAGFQMRRLFNFLFASIFC